MVTIAMGVRGKPGKRKGGEGVGYFFIESDLKSLLFE